MSNKSQKMSKETIILKALDWAYQKAISSSPFPGVESSVTLAQEYSKRKGSIEQQINSLIRWQNTKAATFGFLTGVGGIGVLPIMIPSNIASILFIQVRMIATIALMTGHDLKDDRVKTMVYICMCGTSSADILKSLSLNVGKQAILKLNKELIRKVNSAIGWRLLSRTGETGAVSLTKAIPLLGGVIGGTFDGVTTNIVGNVAKNIFLDKV